MNTTADVETSERLCRASPRRATEPVTIASASSMPPVSASPSTPAVAVVVLVWRGWGLFIPLVVWLRGVLLGGGFRLRPLRRLATRATFQRDVVVAATEAERARIAADIHDDRSEEQTSELQSRQYLVCRL